MKRALIMILAASSYLLAQDTRMLDIQAGGPGGVVGWSAIEKAAGPPVVGAPYSATISNESVQTLADGNRIVESSTGTTARDSQGRTRRDAVLPAIGNLGAVNAPRLVFIQDPVTQTSYTLNLTDKTAQKISLLRTKVQLSGAQSSVPPDLSVPLLLNDAPPPTEAGASTYQKEDKVFVHMGPGAPGPMNSQLPPPEIGLHKTFDVEDH